MHQLLILRHAKAVPWSPRAADFSRPLQPVGMQHARRVAAWMHSHLERPERILCSPAQRTRETLAPLLRLEPRLEPLTHFAPQLYHADTATLVELLDAAFADVTRVLIVGHNPACEHLVGDVLRTRDREAYSRLPTGALAVVAFTPDWFAGRAGGRLAHFVRGKHLPDG